MSVVLKKPGLVEADQLKAANWYDRQQPGLGDDFLDETEEVVSLVAENALLYAVRFDDVRCVRLRRFYKYGVYYVIRGNELRILAIHHGARDSYWLRARKKQLD